MLIHKYKLLVNKGMLKEYVAAGSELLVFYLRDVYNKPKVKGITEQFAWSHCYSLLHFDYVTRMQLSRYPC